MAKNKKRHFIYNFLDTILVCSLLVGLVIFFTHIISSGKLDRKRYPLMYDEIVSKYCEVYDVDRYLVHSIIRTESFFKTDAVSNKGALGLMQIMPDTGKWIADELNLENFTKEDLLDCEKNIMMGVWYLDYLLGRFDYNVETTIAAYNAGPTIVSKWLNDNSLSSDGENLTNIPFDETKKYREKVSNAYSMYLKLYEGAQI